VYLKELFISYKKEAGQLFPELRVDTWVSDIVACQRKTYYKEMGIEQEELLKDVTLESMWEKVRGDLLHYMTYAYRWREMDIEYQVPLKNKTEAILMGRLDMFDWKEKAIIDLKTTKFIKWQIRHGFLPRPEHILQVQCYSIIFSQILEVENLKIVYADMSDIVTYKIQKRDLTEWIRRRIQNIEDSLLYNDAPTGEVSGLCKYCKYQTRCYKDGNGLV
jgi:CRISPR/Cas system-associated exonuclease Cas4 (RecB family)